METYEVPAEFLSSVIDYVEAASQLVVKKAEEEAAVAERAPSVVDTLIKQGFLHENQRKAAESACLEPLKVLDSLQKTAQVASEQRAATPSAPPKLGGANTVKNAGVAPVASKSNMAMEEANARFLSTFGF